MTRINVVPVETLTRQHLIAEYRELPRIYSLAYKASLSSKPWMHKQPADYTLGKSHCIFFYDKLSFLAIRHKQLIAEIEKRGYNASLTECLFAQWQGKIPAGYWKDYEPTAQAIQVNVERINKRLSGDKT